MDLIVCNPAEDPPQEPNQHAKKAWDLHRKFRQTLRTVAKTLDATYAKDDSAYNAHLDKPFKAGDECLLRIRCPVHKFSPRWHGPVAIKKAVNDTIYVVDLNGKEKVVNISKLKRWNGKQNKFSGSCLNPSAKTFRPSSKSPTHPRTPKINPTPSPQAEEITVSVDHTKKKKKRRRNVITVIGNFLRRTPHAQPSDPVQTGPEPDPPPGSPIPPQPGVNYTGNAPNTLRRSLRQRKATDLLQVIPSHKKY